MTTVQTQQVSTSLLNTMNGVKNAAANSAQEAQDRFMTLLISQMKNQDPLNPMDNAQVTSQMAQLSTVSGIDKLNNTLESLISNVQSGQTYQASSMIGHTVQVNGNTFNLSESQSVFAVDLPSKADTVKLTIKNSAGAVVKEINLGAQSSGNLPITWNGLNDAGEKAPDGLYKFEVSATLAGKEVNATAMTYAGVNSISNDSTGVKLHLDNNTSVSTSEVKQVL